METKNTNHESLEDILNQLSIYIKEKNKKFIQDKEMFFQELNQKLIQHKEMEVHDNENFIRPITNFWEQFFFGRKNYSYILSAVVVFLLFSIFIFYQFHKTLENSPSIPEEVQTFGGGNIKQLKLQKEESTPIEEEFLSEEEKQLLETYLREEDPEKKQEILMQLLDYYKKTNQIEKIKKLMEQLD